jgi:tetratricopeptide (TPR) repeat protein
MTRLVPVLCLACATAIGGTLWFGLRGSDADRIAVPATAGNGGAPPAVAATLAAAAAALQAARRSGSGEALDTLVRTRRDAATAAPGEQRSWLQLAEALLERIASRTAHRGLVVGAPTWTQVPADAAQDIDAGLAALETARRLGDDSGLLHRLEASLLGYRVTGLGTALQLGNRIGKALAKAAERAQDDPHLHVILGLRKLLVPKLLGNDPQQALAHFEFAADALPDDERPMVFAGMATYLQQKRQQAIAWLEQAVQRNPANTFAQVVLRRLRAGEDDPFGRDVTPAEAAAGR